MSKARSRILVYLNGERHELGPAHAGLMLADWLRVVRGLTGTKVVCAEGDCGACTVLRAFPGVGKTRAGRSGGFLPVNSCITMMAQLDGSSLVTVEALARPDGRLSHVQDAMRACHGSQCGFCTPGFVMALQGLVEKRKGENDGSSIDEKEARNALTGNLCRCTGYQQILDSARAVDVKTCESVGERYASAAQEKELRAALARPLFLEGEGCTFFAPTSLKAATAWLAKHRDARILASATDLGVVHNKGKLRLEKLLSLHLVPELYALKKGKGSLRVGARVTLTELRAALKTGAPELARFLDLFASPQIKNIATLVGNVANASPIADTPPFLLACGAVACVAGPKGARKIPMDQLYAGYRQLALKPGELLTAIELPLPGKGELLAAYKVSERKDLDISSVNAGFFLRLGADGRIATARLAMGGVAATPLRLPRTERVLVGARPEPALLAKAEEALQAEISPLSDVRGSAAFRRVLAGNLLRRFFREKLEVRG